MSLQKYFLKEEINCERGGTLERMGKNWLELTLIKEIIVLVESIKREFITKIFSKRGDKEEVPWKECEKI